MEEKTREVELHLSDFGQALKRCWVVLLVTVVVVFAGLYITLSAIHVDEYEAEVTIYILRTSNDMENTGGSNNSNMVQSISIANALIDDCKKLMVSRDNVLNPVLEKMPDLKDTTWEDLEKMISIENSGEDRILTLSVRTTDPELSKELADAVADQACDYFNKELYAYTNNGQASDTEQNSPKDLGIASVVDHAEVPTEICNPVSVLLVALISLLAAFIVYVINFIRFLMDDKINGVEDVEKYLGTCVLGVIPNRQESLRHKSKYGYYYGSREKGSQRKQ